MASLSPFANEFLRYLLGSEDGYSDDHIRHFFGERYQQLPSVINELLAVNRLQLFTQGDSLYYKAIKEETAVKFEGLGPEQILVFQAIERSGNKGIWTRDIKMNTNISQTVLTKTLKILEQRSLIKSVRSVASKSKKLYIAFDMTPAKEITGGPWYSDQEFDYEFVEELSSFIVRVVDQLNVADLQTIAEKVRLSGISKIELSTEELESVVNTLVYDYRLEECQASALQMSGHSVAKRVYKVCRAADSQTSVARSFLTEIPCGVCPVFSQCSEDGIISPKTCVYYKEWLDNCIKLAASEPPAGDGGCNPLLNW